MLNTEVTQAIEKGTFAIWPVKRVNEAIELLIGEMINTKSDDGIYDIIRSKLSV